MMVKRGIVNATIAEEISSSGIEISLLPLQEETMRTPIIVLDVPTYMIGGGSARSKRSGRSLKTLMKKMKKFTGGGANNNNNNNNTSPTNKSSSHHQLCEEEEWYPSMNHTMSELTGQSYVSKIRSNETSLSSFLFIKRWREKTPTPSTTGADKHHVEDKNSDLLSAGGESSYKSIVFIEKWEPGLKTCHEPSSSQQ